MTALVRAGMMADEEPESHKTRQSLQRIKRMNTKEQTERSMAWMETDFADDETMSVVSET